MLLYENPMIKVGSVVKLVEPLYGFPLLTNHIGIVEDIILNKKICTVRFFDNIYYNSHITLSAFTYKLVEVP